ncbi:hypothetical protein B0H15DRAFT_1025527 [Mycena belliarum]|uniref:Uncharacterized protein n=1 Tax=Mycena belliarum TaxID=1033014 RepID=A0AAD6XJN8_9AGAR|nr:hypothetical protein B0H15DRAFT_1025527 [Mycena belliae]
MSGARPATRSNTSNAAAVSAPPCGYGLPRPPHRFRQLEARAPRLRGFNSTRRTAQTRCRIGPTASTPVQCQCPRPTGSPRLTRTNASGPPQHPTQPWRQLEAQARAETPWKCLSSAHKRVRTANAIMHGAAPLPSTRGAGAMSARAQTHGKSPPDAQLECAGVPPTAETHRAVPRPRFTTLAVDSWHGCRVRASSNLRGSVRPTRTNATALPSHPARPTAPRVNSRRGKDGRNTRELGTVSEDTSSFASATGPTPLASIRGARRGRYSLAPFSRDSESGEARRIPSLFYL